MKKACIALTVIFLLSSLLAVCFGAAIGAREIRNIIDGNSRFNDWFDSIESWHEHWKDRREAQFLGETRTDFSIDSSERVSLSFDFADVHVLPSQDGAAYMQVRYYGEDPVDDLSSLSYADRESGELRLGVRLPGKDQFTKITAEIYLPAAKLSAFNAQVSVGRLTVEELQFGKLSSCVNVGDTCVKRTSADTAELVTNTGNLTWEDDSRVAKSLSMHADVGDLRLVWPTDAGFRLQYEIGAGDFENRFEEAVTKQSGSQLVSAKGTLAFGDGSRAVALSAATGDITLDSFSDQE